MPHPALAADFHRWGPDATHRRLAALLGRAAEMGLHGAPAPALAAEQLLSMWTGRLSRQQMGLAARPGGAARARHVAQCTDVILRAYAPRGR